MARSLYRRTKNRAWCFDFQLNGKKNTWTFNKSVSRQDAESFRVFFTDLENAKRLGKEPNSSACERLATLDPRYLKRLIELELIDESFGTACVPTLEEHAADFLEHYSANREQTRKNYGQTFRRLFAFFGKTKKLSQITVADAKDYRAYLLREGRALKAKTIRRVWASLRSIRILSDAVRFFAAPSTSGNFARTFLTTFKRARLSIRKTTSIFRKRKFSP